MITGIKVPANDPLQRTPIDKVPRHLRQRATAEPERWPAMMDKYQATHGNARPLNRGVIPMVAVSSFFVRLSIVAALVFGIAASSLGQGVPPADSPSSLSWQEVVESAERFVRENGYTNAPASEVKARLNYESIEMARTRAELLKSPWNTLSPKAIGIKATADGWGVAFDYVGDQPGICRVVTMLVNGADIRMQHEDGLRGFWLGFGDP